MVQVPVTYLTEEQIKDIISQLHANAGIRVSSTHQALELLAYLCYLIPECHFSLDHARTVLARADYPTGDLHTWLDGMRMLKLNTVLAGQTPIYRLTKKAADNYIQLARLWLQIHKPPPTSPPPQPEPEPELKDTSDTVKKCVAQLTDPHEKEFAQETVICSERGAYRSAIVMGWNLAYARLRRWILLPANLPQFNMEHTKPNKKAVCADPINIVDDFAGYRESYVLDKCVQANLIAKDGHVEDVLRQALDDRNKYAHPSTAPTPTAGEVAGHLSKLLRDVLLNPFFTV